MHLPFDVAYLIVQSVATGDDLESVRACCLASKSFVHVCRHRIFSTVDIIQGIRYEAASGKRSNPIRDLIQRFGSLLEENPALSTYVRELKLRFRTSYNPEHGFRFLQCLSQVQAFSFGFPDYITLENCFACVGDESQRAYSSLPSVTISSLEGFIKRNPLIRLELMGLTEVPLSLFRMSNVGRLEEISLLDVSASPVRDRALVSPMIPLKSFAQERSMEFVKQSVYITKTFDLTGLNALSIKFGEHNLNRDARMDDLWDLLRIPRNLESVRLALEGKYAWTA